MSAYFSSGEFVVDYRRVHGVHEFEMRDGMPVTVLSAPTWEEYEAALTELPDTQGYIVSPEIMTSPVPLDQISSMRIDIKERDEIVREASKKHPYARLLLGTARYPNIYGDDQKPYNGVTAYMQGQEIGWQGKKEGSWGEWEYLRSAAGIESRAFAIPSHGLLVCAELMFAAARGISNNPEEGYAPQAAEMIPPSVESVVMMSCWGVPFEYHEEYPIPPEDRYRDVLEQGVRMIFECYGRVEEIIVADRAIVGHGVEPFNAHFKRA